MKKVNNLSPGGLKQNIIALFKNLQQSLKRNSFNILLLMFAFYILTNKDISFSVNMNAAQSSLSPVSTSEKTTFFSPEEEKKNPESDAMAVSVHEEDGEPETQHMNPSIPQRINTISNLGYLLNPFFALKRKSKRHIEDYHNEKCRTYVKQYAKLAQLEMRKYGIPASITLGQALLESNAGDNHLAKNNNNHFGIKCFSKKCAKGHCSNVEGDSHKDFYRNYESVWESYRSHSEFLQKERYIGLKDLGTKDYYGWAEGLMRAGYAQDEKYAKKLVGIIEALDLDRYDE